MQLRCLLVCHSCDYLRSTSRQCVLRSITFDCDLRHINLRREPAGGGGADSRENESASELNRWSPNFAASTELRRLLKKNETKTIYVSSSATNAKALPIHAPRSARPVEKRRRHCNSYSANEINLRAGVSIGELQAPELFTNNLSNQDTTSAGENSWH
jgi:hypothetical protein